MALKAEDFSTWGIFVKKLKSVSPYYPEVLRGERDGSIYLTTKVRIERDGKWYFVHHVRCFMPTNSTDSYIALKTLMFDCYQTIYLWKMSGLEELDTLQISEPERLQALTGTELQIKNQ